MAIVMGMKMSPTNKPGSFLAVSMWFPCKNFVVAINPTPSPLKKLQLDLNL